MILYLISMFILLVPRKIKNLIRPAVGSGERFDEHLQE